MAPITPPSDHAWGVMTMRKVGLVLLIFFALLKGGEATASMTWGGRGCSHPNSGPRPLYACFRSGPVSLVPLH